MIKLKYVQANPKTDRVVVISARISTDEKKFIEKNNINMTNLVKAALKEVGYNGGKNS